MNEGAVSEEAQEQVDGDGHGVTPDITKREVEEALKKVRVGKAAGPDEVPTEVWRLLGGVGVGFLTRLFNRILEGTVRLVNGG